MMGAANVLGGISLTAFENRNYCLLTKIESKYIGMCVVRLGKILLYVVHMVNVTAS